MRTLVAVAWLTVTAALVPVRDSAAQDLVVSNARIVDGKGGVIERGSVVVRDGKIVSVSSGTPARVSGAQTHRCPGPHADAGLHRCASTHRAGRSGGVAREACGAADAGVSRCRFHHRAVRDLSRSGDRVAAANRVWRGEGAAPVSREHHSARASGRSRPRWCRAWRRPRRRSRPLRQLATSPASDCCGSGHSRSRDDQGRRGSGEQEVRLHQDSDHYDARRTGDGHAEADRVRRQEAQPADDHARGLGDRHARRR